MNKNHVPMGAYHAPAWAGIVVSEDPGQGAAFRFLVSRRGERADWLDMTNLLVEVGPAAHDGLYARLGFDTTRPFTRSTQDSSPSVGNTTFTLEWSRADDYRLVARACADYRGVCELRGYFPWDWVGTWAIDRSDLVAQWGQRASGILVQVVHRPALRGLERGRAILESSGDAGVRFEVDLGSRIYVDCQLISGEPDPLRTPPDIEEIDRTIAEARHRYDERRAFVAGRWTGLAEAVTSASQWSVLMQPESGERYLPAGREWVFPTPDGDREPWMTFAWDSFLNALSLGVEAPQLADSAMRVVLETQYPNGNVPNWRGRIGGTPDRSQPPIGSFVVLKHYLRTGNRETLEWALPYLRRWNEWWYAPKGQARRRDGNANGLFNWGCDRELISPDAPAWERDLPLEQYAAWESSQGDLPHWDEAAWSDSAQTMDLDAVDLNSYLALDFECLSRMAAELGDSDNEIRYLEQYRALRKRINERLWDEESGMYRDRHWDGRWSPHVGAANFLPLLAGIPSPDQAQHMVKVLTDSKQFWGRYAVPTLSRDNPAHSDDAYWRGAIRGPTNYLIYQGLRRYELDGEAAELAHRSVDMYLACWKQHQATFERFGSTDGTGRGKRHHGSSALFALMGIEEFIDITPWDALRIGTAAPVGENTLHRIQLFGQQWTIGMSARGLTVAANGVDILHANGPTVLRDLVFEPGGLSARTAADAAVEVTIPTMTGAVHCDIDGTTVSLRQPTFTVPAGTHRIRVRAAG